MAGQPLPHSMTEMAEFIRGERNRRAAEKAYKLDRESIAAVRRRCRRSLMAFVREAWSVLEPEAFFIEGWHLNALAQHLEAVTDGQITRLLCNIPPGSMKSLMVSVFWPAWEWGPRNMTTMRYIATSFKEDAVLRDNRRMRALVTSEWFQKHWPEVSLIRSGELSFENSMTGWREGAAFGSLTSKRGDRLIIDDPHSVEKAESKLDRERTVARFREGAINRLNDQANSAIVVIMQRVNEGDISGTILDNEMGYTALILPMEYESTRHCETILFSDPRSKEGELLCEDRFSREVVNKLKIDMGNYAFASQYQQRPAPRGGGIIPYTSWEFWDKEIAFKYGKNENQFPDMDFIIAAVDGAFTEKTQNDMTAMTVLGVWTDIYGFTQVMVMFFWQARLALYPAVEKIIATATRMKVDKLLIENKATGIPVSQEIVRLTREEKFTIELVNPDRGEGVGDTAKIARANAISIFHREEREGGQTRPGCVYVPCLTTPAGSWPRTWADTLMAQCASFPKGKHDDAVDSYVYGMLWLRKRGMIRRQAEVQAEERRALMAPTTEPQPLYPG